MLISPSVEALAQKNLPGQRRESINEWNNNLIPEYIW